MVPECKHRHKGQNAYILVLGDNVLGLECNDDCGKAMYLWDLSDFWRWD